MLTEIEKIQRHAKRIANGKDRVIPGQEVRFTAACVDGDCIRQGDLYITVASVIPEGYVRIENPGDTNRQLVPGNTVGARHCLDSLYGIEMWHPLNWNAESLDGPFLKVIQERTIEHPVHGNVILVPGISYLCEYQVEYDRELRKARRAAD